MFVIAPETIWTIFSYLSITVFALIFSVLVYIIIMHNILYRRLDPILFQKPWFNQAELTMYSTWPFSFNKTLQYMGLLTFPEYMKKKRFKGLKKIPEVSSTIKNASKIYIYLQILTALVGIAWFTYIGVILLTNETL